MQVLVPWGVLGGLRFPEPTALDVLCAPSFSCAIPRKALTLRRLACYSSSAASHLFLCSADEVNGVKLGGYEA